MLHPTTITTEQPVFKEEHENALSAALALTASVPFVPNDAEKFVGSLEL